MSPLRLVACALAAAAAAAASLAAPPLVESRCPAPGSTPALVDAAFRDAALGALERLAISAPGQPADGAIRAHQTAAHLDAEGHAWHHVSAYAVNLGMVGALATGPRALPLAAAWLGWQARHTASTGSTRGVVLDHWVRADTLEESTCPSGLPSRQCSEVDAWDSTAASMLLAADAYLRAGGDPLLLRQPAMRQALEDAAMALTQLSNRDQLTLAKPTHPVVYTMDQVEVVAGRRAWARLQRDVYAQPASADVTEAVATAQQTAVRKRLAFNSQTWAVSQGAGAPAPTRWYPDTVAQAWPLLWLLPGAEKDFSAANWQRSIAPWQGSRRNHWANANVDPDGFWWPAVAVAALCTGDEANARIWVARARQRWMDPASPFAWPFQVGDLLWLLWMAEPSAAAVPSPSPPPRASR